MPILTLIAIIIAWKQISLNRKVMLADHDKDRRKFAIDLIWKFVNIHEKESKPSRGFVNKLDPGQITDLMNCRGFKIGYHLRESAISALNSEFTKIDEILPNINGQDIYLDEVYVRFIRNSITRYLNRLETIMSSWRHEVADREIIEEEFKYMGANEEHSMTKLRQHIGFESFPAIDDFMKKIQGIRSGKGAPEAN